MLGSLMWTPWIAGRAALGDKAAGGAAGGAGGALERAAAAFAYRETGNPFPVANDARPPLRVGLCSSLSCGFLRELILRVRADPDGPRLEFHEGAPEELIKAASYGALDVAFVHGARDWWRLAHEELWRERLMVLAPEGHPLTQEAEVDPRALRDETVLVAGDGAELDFQTALLARAIGAAPADVRAVAVAVEKETLFDLVSLGDGVAITTASSGGAFHPGVAFRPLTGPAASIPFHAVWRASNCDGGLAGVLEMARAIAAAGAG